MFRPWAEMIPALTLEASPKGLPIATTQSPTRIASESPSLTNGSFSTFPLSLITATSVSGSRPTTCASKRSEEHTSELQSRQYLVCRLLLEKKKQQLQTDGRMREQSVLNLVQ